MTASEYHKVAYIIKTNENAATMKDRVAEMVKLGKFLTDDHSTNPPRCSTSSISRILMDTTTSVVKFWLVPLSIRLLLSVQ